MAICHDFSHRAFFPEGGKLLFVFCLQEQPHCITRHLLPTGRPRVPFGLFNVAQPKMDIS
jgi:hypothetical protein